MANTIQKMALSSRQTLNSQRVRRISGRAMKIATWNVKSMYTKEKVKNIELEMQRLNLDIIGISESRLKGTGIETADDTLTYYSGNDDKDHWNGVAVMIKKQLQSSVLNFLPISDRVMLIQFRATPININIVQVYAPTASKNHDDAIEPFYGDLKKALCHLKAHECNIVMGDFNSKIGQGTVQEIVGQHSLGERNDRGDRLVQFCQEEQMIVTNTFFKLPPRRLYTWTSPAHTVQNIVRNQIDFILVNKRFKNSFKSVKTYPGADIGSDHNPVIATIYCKMKKLTPPKMPPKINTAMLRDKNTKLDLQAKLNNRVHALQEQAILRPENPDRIWYNLKSVLIKTSLEVLTPPPILKKKTWIDEHIIKLMSERREKKGIDPKRYRELHREIGRKCIEAKDKWINDECQELENLQEKHDYFNMFKKIKEILGFNRQKPLLTLLDDNGKMATTIQEKLNIWENYIKQLFSDNRRHPAATSHICDCGPNITKEEIVYAIKSAKSGKAVGSDDIPSEILKLVFDENFTIIAHLFNGIYDSGIIPDDWLQSTFVTLPKINNAKRCNDYRLISLMSHILKIFLKIIHNRIYKKIEENLSNTQFGFRNGFGTRDALFGYQVLLQRCWDIGHSVHICFIDYEKAFDKVQHEKLFQILHDIGLDSKDLKIIQSLYWNQKAKVRVGQVMTEKIDIMRGVRQGCILSPLLFNIYAETIFKEALDGADEGIIVNGHPINNIRYADDTILLAASFEDLQKLVNRVDLISASYGLNINFNKTKLMTVGKTQISGDLTIRNQTIKRVRSYKYLGCFVNDQGDHSVEIKCRIEQARHAFVKLQSLLCNRALRIHTRVRLARCYVFSVLLYGVESWTLTQATSKRLEAFEMWVYRRILRISWSDRVSNEKVLQLIGTKVEIIKTIQIRKLQYLGHIMRNNKYQLLQLIMQGKIQGRRKPGRRRTSWLKNLRTWFKMSTRSLFRAAVSKVKIALMIADLR